MPNKKLILLIGIISLFFVIPAFAQNPATKEYKVQKGDTLWDISKKELNDPFLWPKVWKENPEIANPDRLQPGQIVIIPLYVIQKEEPKEEPVKEPVVEAPPPPKPAPVVKAEPAPPPLKPLVDANLFVSSGYISDSAKEIGKITGSQSGKTLLSSMDMVYIKTKSPARLGDRFHIFRKGLPIKHPITKKSLGSIVEIVGVAEVKKYENGETVAQIQKTYGLIEIGDLLDNYTEQTPPVVAKPFRKPDISGYIVEAKYLRLNNGTYDILYIDKGSKDGLAVGDLLKSVAVGKHKVSNGIVQIIKTMESTSVAFVRDSTNSIMKGNQVTKAE